MNSLLLLAFVAQVTPTPTQPSAVAAKAAPPQKSLLMTIGVDGSDPRLVYETTDRIEAPNWTKDGQWLVFNSKGRLHKVAAKGGAPTPIDTGGVGDINNDHGLTPNGKTIIFSAKGHVYLVPLEGGQPKRISSDQGEAEGLVHWWHGISPDSKTHIFTGQRGEVKELYTIPYLGGPLKLIAPHPAEDDGPEFSPDGKWIYFNSERSGSNQIWRMPAKGGALKQITNDERVNWFPHTSPNGKWIVYLSFPTGTRAHPKNKQVILRRMKPDGSGRADIRAFNGGQGTINVPSWSPDSKRFSFVEYSPLEGAR